MMSGLGRRVVVAVLFGSAVAVTAAAGCTHYKAPAERLREAVLDYNNAIRWQHWKVAVGYIPVAKRAEWVARREAQADSIRVTDFEVRDVHHEPAEKRAYVLVEFAWHRYPSLTMRRTRVRQEWSSGEPGSDWVLLGQAEVEIEEPSDDPADIF